jgi:serine/threonine protein kinase
MGPQAEGLLRAWDDPRLANVTSHDGDTSHDGAQAFALGELVAERYKIARLIGSGSSGEVYEAHDQALGVAVALKTLREEMARHPVQLERFRREIQNARRVTHPNICRIFDMGVQRSGRTQRFFLTMELLPGESLASFISRHAPMSTADTLPLITQIASGLQAAHDVGVVHRDLKPGNIMIADANTGVYLLRATITDFGLAISADQAGIGLTESDEILGTPEYMAPEQAMVGAATPASDVYAMGLIAYEMLAKRRPFDAEASPIATILKRNREPPRPLRVLLPNVDAKWDAAILKCLQKDPVARFQRPADFIAALPGGRAGKR